MRTLHHALPTCLLSVLLLALLSGCETTKQQKKGEAGAPKPDNSRGLLSFHKYFSTNQEGTGAITLYHLSGKAVYVEPKPLLTSRLARHIEPYPAAGGFGLNIFLEPHGQYLWTQITNQYHSRHLALLLDGEFLALVLVPKSSASGAFSLDGPFSQEQVDDILGFIAAEKRNRRE